jgi:hypothetical protein
MVNVYCFFSDNVSAPDVAAFSGYDRGRKVVGISNY